MSACGVLWDLDGTLVDSTELHWIAWRDLRADVYVQSLEELTHASWASLLTP